MCEEPASAVLQLSHLSTNCSTCLTAVVAGLPCPTCSTVIFCSPACRTAALETFHRLECCNLHLFPPAGPLCPALRLFTSRQVGEFSAVREELKEHRAGAGWEQHASSLLAAHSLQVSSTICRPPPAPSAGPPWRGDAAAGQARHCLLRSPLSPPGGLVRPRSTGDRHSHRDRVLDRAAHPSLPRGNRGELTRGQSLLFSGSMFV